MTAIPSGTPTPTAIAVGKLAECSWVWTGTEVEFGPDEKVVVTGLREVVLAANCEDVTGGNPSIVALVSLAKLALIPC